MRVHVSPWEIAKTSLQVAAVKKRRREDKDSSDVGVVSRFIQSNRLLKNHQFPALIITGSNRIVVLGTHPDGEKLREIDDRQYYSRKPFLDEEGLSIPALYDGKREMIYALQTDNKELLCWPATGGPDQAQKFQFEVPVRDICLTRLAGASILYGTRQDGKLFFVNENMKVCYVDLPTRSGLILATLVRPKSDVGTKRKGTPEHVLLVHQIIQEEANVIVWLYEIKLELGDTAEGHILKTDSSSFRLVSETMINAQLVGLSEGSNMIGIRYGTAGKEPRQWFTPISLEKDIAAKGVSIELPEDTQCAGLVGPALAVGTATAVIVFDTTRGARIHQQTLPDYDKDHGYELVTDEKRTRLSVTFVQDKTICVAWAVGKFHARLSSIKQGGLACSLASSLEATPPSLQPGQFVWSTSVLNFDEGSNIRIEPRCESVVERSVTVMLDAYNMILEGAKEASSPSFLLSTYERALELVLDESDTAEVADNPQDAVPSVIGAVVTKCKNGFSHSAKKQRKLVNGVSPTSTVNGGNGEHSDPKNLADSEMPGSLVDCIATIIVRLLCNTTGELPGTVRTDACSLLSRLLKTRKVLARSHLLPDASDNESFPRLLRALEVIKLEERGTYSPVDLVFDVISYCSDVSEKQMVALLQFLFRRASADDIADQFSTSEDEQLRELCQRYTSRQHQTSPGEGESSKRASIHLLKFGAAILLRRILAHSSCNDSLLRGALVAGLSRKEMGILSRMLISALEKPTAGLETDEDLGRTISLRAIHWLSALCDCIREEAVDSSNLNISLVRRQLAAEISRTEAILSLKGTLTYHTGVRSSSATQSHVRVAFKLHDSEQIPPYQVERLLF